MITPETLRRIAEVVEHSTGSPAIDLLVYKILNKLPGYDVLRPGLLGSPTTDIGAARRLCSWVLLHASDIGADGLAMVKLGNPGTAKESIGIGYGGGPNALACAWTAAAIRALAQDHLT